MPIFYLRELKKLDLYLAPLMGITDGPFRRLFIHHFSHYDAVMAPFVAVAPESRRVRKSFLKRQGFSPKDTISSPIQIPQILNKDCRGFLTLAEAFLHLGYRRINLNAACPAPEVLRGGRGAALLENPSALEKLLTSFFESSLYQQGGLSLSLKIRLPRRSSAWLPLINLFKGYPLEGLMLHPRRADQFYRGKPQKEAFRFWAEEWGTQEGYLAYSGDIFRREDWQRIREEEGDRPWLLGRGAVANPFLAAEIRGMAPSNCRKRELFFDFYHDLVKNYQKMGYPEKRLLPRLKGLWSYWARSFQSGSQFLNQLRQCRGLAEGLTLIDQWERGDHPWRGLKEEMWEP